MNKRIIIISVYLLILVLIIFGIYSWLKPGPSCLDGKQNQNEQGVDCGGICARQCAVVAKENLVVLQAGFVPSGVGNNYDVYAEVKNPNQTLGSGNFSYRFSIKNSAGSEIATSNGNGFILPGETKYLVKSNLSLPEAPVQVALTISSTQWSEVSEFYEKPQLKVVSKQYSEITSGTGFAEATGLLKNESPIDFETIKLEIILKDAGGNIIALNSTEMNTVKAGENRDFRALWPNRFPGTVANMEVQPEVNVFNSDSFVRRNFKAQPLQ